MGRTWVKSAFWVGCFVAGSPLHGVSGLGRAVSGLARQEDISPGQILLVEGLIHSSYEFSLTRRCWQDSESGHRRNEHPWAAFCCCEVWIGKCQHWDTFFCWVGWSSDTFHSEYLWTQGPSSVHLTPVTFQIFPLVALRIITRVRCCGWREKQGEMSLHHLGQT